MVFLEQSKPSDWFTNILVEQGTSCVFTLSKTFRGLGRFGVEGLHLLEVEGSGFRVYG
jgi:hypothetical protein